MTTPEWLEVLAIISLLAAGISSAIIVIDIAAGHQQHMWIMNVVWPVTALYFGPLALAAYFHWGRLDSHHAMMKAKESGEPPPAKKKPFWGMCAVATTHCGGGCTLGDIIAEWILLPFSIALWGHKLFADWAADYVIAFLLGIAFQYFTIKPMGNLSITAGLAQAVKADALSITCWQIGMYGWMAISTFLIFRRELPANTVIFWFMMQFAMWFGFATAYPVNWWLLKQGVKETM